MSVRIWTATIALCLFGGCDTGTPSVDRGIRTAEVITGEGLQFGGGAAIRAPEPKIKGVGAAAIAGGIALEQDGRARIGRANAREQSEIIGQSIAAKK